MRRPLGGLGMAAVLAQTLVLSGMAGIEPPERSITPRDPWDDDDKPRTRNPFDDRRPRPSPEPTIKSGEKYDKAEAKRQRKAAKRIRDKFEV